MKKNICIHVIGCHYLLTFFSKAIFLKLFFRTWYVCSYFPSRIKLPNRRSTDCQGVCGDDLQPNSPCDNICDDRFDNKAFAVATLVVIYWEKYCVFINRNPCLKNVCRHIYISLVVTCGKWRQGWTTLIKEVSQS